MPVNILINHPFDHNLTYTFLALHCAVCSLPGKKRYMASRWHLSIAMTYLACGHEPGNFEQSLTVMPSTAHHKKGLPIHGQPSE